MKRRTIFLVAAGLGAAAAGLRYVRRPKDSLDGAVVIVTGASRGLGLMLAREFATRRARLAICARDGGEVERAREALSSRGLDVFARRCDVRERREVERFIAEVAEHFGGIDVLVNNAGTIQVGPAAAMTERDYQDALQTHFWGPYYMVEAALPALRASPRARIVNIVSIGGLVSVPHLLPYSVSKFALAGYSLGLHAELARKGISVTTVCPGLMRTGSARNAWFKAQHRAEYGWFSLSAALPFTSTSARSAARRIVRAAIRRERLVVLTLQAQLLAAAQHVFPSATLAALSLAARLLPKEGGIGTDNARGYESATAVTESFLTTLSKRAEIALHQR
jgi:NAD(P)-dependent dehydrogenase (short-subunit alcohol dehydrogenase family)